MSLARALESTQAGLPVTNRPELAPSVHWMPAQRLPVHRWFRYREGFSPYLLDHFADSRFRFDPFCGCGTTLLESARRGVWSAGVDINPLATFLARTKTRRYTTGEARLVQSLAEEALRSYRVLRPEACPPYPLLRKVFLPESLSALLRLKRFVSQVDNPRVRSLLKLAWLSILEDASNVFKEGNGLKYRNKVRHPERYVTLPDRVWIPRYFGPSVRAFVEGLWLSKCREIAEDLTSGAVRVTARPQVRTGSCLKRSLMPDEPIDLAVFSPPYANRFDYFEAFKMELWMGDFVKTAEDVSRLRAGSVRSNLAAKKFDGDESWDRLAPFLNAMDERASSVRMGIKRALQGYFHDMRILLRNLRESLARRGRVVIVVGNSAYARVIVPTDVLMARLAQEEGFRVRQVSVARHLHVSSQQRSALSRFTKYMRESVLVFDRGRPGR